MATSETTRVARLELNLIRWNNREELSMLRNTGWRSRVAKETIISMIDEFKDPEDVPIVNIEMSVMELFVLFYEILENQNLNRHSASPDYTRSVVRNMMYLEPAIEISLLGWLDCNESGNVLSRFSQLVDNLGVDIFNDREDIAYYTRSREVS